MQLHRFVLPLATALLTSLVPMQAIAKTPLSIPRELSEAVSALDRFASQQQLENVLSFYSDDLRHSDGVTKEQLRQQLQELWKRYPQLQYSTRIVKLEGSGDRYTAETVTEITGKNQDRDNPTQLKAKVISRQEYQRQGNSFRIVSQEIISERSTLLSGSRPPQVNLKLPEIIGVGRQFALDAIVTEPLNYSVLLGAVIDEPVNPKNYLQTNSIRLQPLRAGGLFRIGQAPFSPGDRWISVVLLREDGMTITTQRLRVSRDQVGNQYTPLPNLPFTPSRIRPAPNQTPPSS